MMSIKVLELTKNSELVELSIDEQMRIGGGITPESAKRLYNAALSGYADGKVDIAPSGSDPNVTIFTPRPGAYPPPSVKSASSSPLSLFGNIGFNVQGDNPVYVGSIGPNGNPYNI
jgi:hypothetical protein